MKTMLFALCFALVLLSGEALSQAETVAPFSSDGLKALLPMLLVAALGGAVSFLQKVKAGEARAFNISEMVGEMVIASFAGMLTYWLCRYFTINEWLMAALVGMAGHAGSRAIFVMEKVAERKVVPLFLKSGEDR